MKTKNFLITLLLALLLMPVGAKALTVSKQDTIQVGNAAYICAYDVDTEKTLATPTITPKGATLVAYDLNATARSFTVPSTITVSIRVKTNSYEKTFTVKGITGIATGTSGSIMHGAFEGNTALRSVTIPETVGIIGKEAFKDATRLQTVTFSGTPTLANIAASAFEGCTSLASFTIPSSVTQIGASAFKDCTSLVNADIYVTTTSIDPTAFSGCNPDNVTYTIRPNGDNTTVPADMLSGCEGVGKVQLADGITAIADEAFMGCTNLTSLQLPTGLETIGARAFKGCTRLPGFLNIPQTVKTIASEAFSGTHITMAHMYTTLQNIATDAFDSNDTHLIVFIDALTEGSEQQTSIPGIFGNCNFIWGVSIGADVESIGYHAFSNCSNLEWARWATNASRLKFINEGAFAGCQKLKEFGDQAQAAEYPGNACVIPDGVQLIYHSAFADCSALKEVVLPASIIHIGQGAFTCSSEGALQSVTVNWTTPITPDLTNYGDPFPADKSTINLHVPAGTEGAYQANSYWSQFSIVADASFVKDGIRYAFNSDHTALQVVGYVEGYTPQSIPASININGTTYPVTAIAGEAFKGCGITSLILFTTLESIATDAFDSEGIIFFNIMVPTSVEGAPTRIHDGLFEGCQFLKGISILDGVTAIGNDAFRNCTSLQWVSVANASLSTIGNSTFKGCTNLTDFANTDQGIDACVIPDGVTQVYPMAFAGCSKLEEVVLPVSISYIGYSAFDNTASGSEGALQSVTVNWTNPITPDLTNYGDPFPADKSTITLHVPAGTEATYQANTYWNQFNIINDGFIEQDGLRYAFNSDQTALQVVGYVEGYTPQSIPTSIDINGTTYPVTAIASNAFKGCAGITSLILYTTLESIATDAFDSEGIIFFNIMVPTSVEGAPTRIHDGLFEDCQFLKGISILNDVDLIGAKAFRNCTNLQWVSLATPDQLRGIGNGAFMNCESLTDFNNTDQAIDACIIPEGVLEIGAQAFAGAAFTSVQIPASVTDLGLAPFADCTQLTTITVDPANTTYESPEGCNGIITNSEVLVQACPATVIPQSVTELYGAWLFASYLTDFTVPSGIKYIGNYSFYASTLASVTIPATVEGINAYAFNNNALRGNITVLRPTPPELIETAFSDATYENATLIVPAGALAAYQAHTVWGRFLNIEEIPAGSGDVNGGGIDMSDVLDLANYIIGKTTSGTFDTAAADVNGNGDITIADVTELLKKVITPYDPTNDKKELQDGAEAAKTRCHAIETELQGKPDSDRKVSLQKDLADVVTSIDALRNMIEAITTQEQVKTCQVELKIINTRLNSIEEQVNALPNA